MADVGSFTYVRGWGAGLTVVEDEEKDCRVGEWLQPGHYKLRIPKSKKSRKRNDVVLFLPREAGPKE